MQKISDLILYGIVFAEIDSPSGYPRLWTRILARSNSLKVNGFNDGFVSYKYFKRSRLALCGLL